MITEQFLLLFAVAAAAGALGSALGMAGGIFVVPALILITGASFPAAVAISLISVIACSCASAPQLLTAGLANLRLALVLEVATTLGALMGILMIGSIPDRALYAIFTAVLLISAAQMLSGRRTRPVDPRALKMSKSLRLGGSYPHPGGSDVHYEVSRLPEGMTLMFGAGLLSALLGIGSGVLKIPAMDSTMRLPLKVSSATANFTIGVTACGTAAAYFLAGKVDLSLAAPAISGSVVGAVLGARILIQVSGRVLRILFIVILLAVSVPMSIGALGGALT